MRHRTSLRMATGSMADIITGMATVTVTGTGTGTARMTRPTTTIRQA